MPPRGRERQRDPGPSDIGPVPVLERACFLATWCSVARFHTATRKWLYDATALAAGPLFGFPHVPCARG